jgi:3-oxoacyl-(acyl-carrier-protein) synthase/SAM-dependent methyltransferase/acyl carrier protein
MAQHDNSEEAMAPAAEHLTPVKRALIEIRRLRAELESRRRPQHGAVAIVGLAVRLPGGIASPERFWKALADGEDLIATVPAERWDAHAYWSSELDQPGTMYDIHGGFLSDVEAFDADFFGIHPREAASMDPQQRMLLELTWEALERAAIDPRSLMNTKTGIYLGLTNSDYSRVLTEDFRKIDGYTGVGAAMSIAAGRLAYFLGTHGPAVVVDTACSSSLVALHQAVQSLRQGETDLAIVGAANLILSPEMNIGFSRTRMLSRSGRSKAFDASADGYVRAEGCCVIVLKRADDATREGDRILANIHGTAVNQDGRSAGITAPNGPAQEAVMRAALHDAGLVPQAIDYIEAHGTGTPLGDPMEFQAIGEVYGAGRSWSSPLHIGSVKTNLGHTEAAAGLTGLIKVVLMMQPGGAIVPHLHFKEPSPQIDWQRWPIEVPPQLIPWRSEGGVRFAGVSSFGFSGTNVHVILGSCEITTTSPDVPATPTAAAQEESLLCLSAADHTSLREVADRYIEHLRQSKETFHDICYTAAVGRAKLKYRVALRASSTERAAEMLEQWLSGRSTPGLMTNSRNAAETESSRGLIDALDRTQREFVEGGVLRWEGGRAKKVDLPVYPFQRKRFWFGDSPMARQQRERDDAWQFALGAAQRQSQQAPLGWSTNCSSEKWAALAALTHAHARNVLAAAGAFADNTPSAVDDVLHSCKFQPIYRRLVGRWLSALAEDGALIQSSGSFHAVRQLHPVDLDPYWEKAAAWLADDPPALDYLKRCGSLLGEVLTGRVSPLETLFPEGSFALAESLYETSAGAIYLNPIVASSVREAARVLGTRRNVRVLEIGGGTGGTTSAVLPQLHREQAEYWFTDVSELFLHRAQRKFGGYRFVRYALFDLDRDLEQQGFRSGMFDIVVAANVVHAVRNLEAALRRIHRLLAPGGLLILLETTHHHTWFDMSTGLIEGWQQFEDADRQDHPLLNPNEWRAILARTGFENATALPDADSPASNLGQHVILARSSCAAAAQNDSTNTPFAVAEKQRTALPATATAQVTAAIHVYLQDLPTGARERAVSTIVKETICNVFRLDTPPEALGDRDRLSDLGMDSLIALELRSELSKRLGLEGKISSTIAFDTGTVGELTRLLSGLLRPFAEQPSESGNLPPMHGRQVKPHYHTAEQLEQMSDEEIEQLLKERLSRQ